MLLREVREIDTEIERGVMVLDTEIERGVFFGYLPVTRWAETGKAEDNSR